MGATIHITNVDTYSTSLGRGSRILVSLSRCPESNLLYWLGNDYSQTNTMINLTRLDTRLGLKHERGVFNEFDLVNLNDILTSW